MNERTFDTGKVILNYAESPAAGRNQETLPALVMLHGGSGNWQLLEHLILPLSTRWHCFAPDLRGHGKSGRVAWGYTLHEYAKDIAIFLQQVSGAAFLFGHSLGGIVALMTAGLNPKNVRGVLVADSPLDATFWKAAMQGENGMIQRWRELSGGSYTVEQIVAELKQVPVGSFKPETGQPLLMSDVYPDDHPVYLNLAERLYQHDPDVLGMLLEDFDRAAEGYEMDTLFPAIRCPVLLLQADPNFGGAMTDEEVQHALTFLPHPFLTRFPGLSHLLLIEDPDSVLRVMEDFLYRWS